MNFKRTLCLGFSLLTGLAILTGSDPKAHAGIIPPKSVPGQYTGPKPKLIVVLVIDQFRSDYITRTLDRFMPAYFYSGKVGGFRYLIQSGATFPFAQYDILQCMTGPGHATILTGSLPYQAGIPLNEWFDSTRGKPTYCVEDKDSPLVTTQVGKTHLPGTSVSPKNLRAVTFGDELKNVDPSSRVISIALKDRAAILMGGHRADLALWFHPESSRWISSHYYTTQSKFPNWVRQVNTTLPKDLSRLVAEKPELGKHSLQQLLATPVGLAMTELAAEQAIQGLKLGQGKGTDLLALSFSSHDLAGHEFGPNSPEMEKMTLAEDQVLSRLFNTIRTQVPGGLKNTLILLTADHGVAPLPEWSQERKIEAGRIDQKNLAAKIDQRFTEKYGAPQSGKWVSYVHDFNFSLNRKELESKAIHYESAENEAKQILLMDPGTQTVITSTDFLAHHFPPGLLGQQVTRTYFPGRSGDLILVPRPYFTLGGEGEDRASHVTGFGYDRSVPLIFSGPGIRPGKFATPAAVIDIAPTLAFIAGTLPPAQSEGRVLWEIFK